MFKAIFFGNSRHLTSPRHGARLDAADKQWHLTSPTPYDPPLTYGGWKQAQALGARIASILRWRETTVASQLENGVLTNPSLAVLDGYDKEKEGSSSHRPIQLKRRQQRVIVHSSPFLRCVQTSIAISAGLQQHQGPHNPSSHSSHSKPHQHPHPHPYPHTMHSASPRLRAMDHWNSPQLSAIAEPGENAAEVSKTQPKSKSSQKPRLRIDTFLGEWLSPDYFDMITPPPNSVMMVASAKADLLRHGDHVDILSSKSTLSRGNFPGGWTSGRSLASNGDMEEDGPLANISDLSRNLPRIGRSNSHTGAGLLGSRTHQNSTRTVGKAALDLGIYTPPTPAYAISPVDPIPPGYVAHARDACVDIDYQWDSMRLPHDWGDGGSIGEEWSSMHKRFRRGLQSMITWYRQCDTRARGEIIRESDANHNGSIDEDDEEPETILVLVTHGAGCNALIGALTNQPVLLDVGMASLTMAVRKSNPKNLINNHSSSSSSTTSSSTEPPPITGPPRRRSVIDPGVSDDYEIKLIASTDHLRHSSQSSPISLTQRAPTVPSLYSPRPNWRSGSGISTISGGSLSSDTGSSLDHDDRSTAAMPSSPGLWTKPVSRSTDLNQDPTPHFPSRPRQSGPENAFLATNSVDAELKPHGLDDDVDAAPAAAAAAGANFRSVAPNGLWGAAPQALGTERERGQKRRWTHSEQR